MKLNKIKINKKIYKIYLPNGVFKPTATTKFLLNGFFSRNKKIRKKKILDLGCGSGIVSVVVNKKFKSNIFFASDLSSKAINCCRKNFSYSKIKGVVKKGSLLRPWEKNKFDIILNDISGVSEDIAKKSLWFRNIPVSTGNDGSKLTISVIKNSSNFLNNKGKLYLPIISLSNEKKIVYYAKKKFKKVKIISSDSWFLPKEIEKYNKLLFKLKKENKINFEYKFGKFICSTKILELKNY